MNHAAVISIAFALVCLSSVSSAQTLQSGLSLSRPDPAMFEQDSLDLAAHEVQGMRTELIDLYDRVPSFKATRAVAVLGGVASIIGLSMFMADTDPFASQESSRSPYIATTLAVGGTIAVLTSILVLAIRGRKQKAIKKRIASLERDIKLRMTF